MRSAQPADLAVIHSLTQKAYSVWLPVIGYPAQPVTEDHAPRLARGEILLACDDKGVVGLIVVAPAADHDLIFSVAVDPDHAGQGIGPRLIGEAERRAKANGKRSMTLYTNALMARNIALYQKLGYVETGRRPNPARPEFTIVDMDKVL
ncbi:MAG: GNAT family N-acetyltransferase [Proteobacteria bacterium]|nr:GNAT family N-acetyltransferase [Pseudomonadota bacterium]